MFKLNIVLFQPEIPQNTGNIARTCAALGASLHLIRPYGFSLRDRYLKRAGLDYWNMVNISEYTDIEAFFAGFSGKKHYFLTKTADKAYDRIDFSGEVFLIFGKETAGIPAEILERNPELCFRIPMMSGARSLNLSNAVAVAAYEGFRQNRFYGLEISKAEEE